jgi:hypothetical protein
MQVQMTRGADELAVSDHAVLRYLQRVLDVDVDAVRRLLHDETATARAHNATGATVNGVVYRLASGYVTTVFVGNPFVVRRQHAAACKKILRKSKEVPLLANSRADDDDAQRPDTV